MSRFTSRTADEWPEEPPVDEFYDDEYCEPEEWDDMPNAPWQEPEDDDAKA